MSELDRRTLLSWLGSGTVLSLAGALAACGNGTKSPTASDGFVRREQDAGEQTDLAPPADASSAEAMPADSGVDGFPFRPAEPDHHGVFDKWGERTVDQQNLKAILAGWTLSIEGMVAKPKTFSFGELLTTLRRTDQVVDFHCVEGWSIHDVPWNGIRFSDLLDAVEPTEKATHVTVRGVTGKYIESIPLDIAGEEKTLLAYGIAGSTIPLRHGFPLRLVIPRLLAYKSAKYVERIIVEDRPREGFWVERGYNYDAIVPDHRLRSGKY